VTQQPVSNGYPKAKTYGSPRNGPGSLRCVNKVCVCGLYCSEVKRNLTREQHDCKSVSQVSNNDYSSIKTVEFHIFQVSAHSENGPVQPG